MVNNIPVNGWPQLKDLEAVQPILNRLDKIEAWKRTVKEETFTGEEITIDSALALPARSLKTTINAIQDLHGYDKPWSGGSGKNKLPMTVASIKAANTGGTWSGNVYTINGGTITILTDSDGNVTGFKVNGTFNAQMTFYLLANYGTLSDMFGSGNFVLSQGVAFNFADPTGIMLQKQEAGANIYIQIGATEVAFTSPDANHYRPIIRFQSGNTLNNAVIQPMVRVSTESASFAPYSNICPISGRTAVAVDDDGANLASISAISTNANGAIATSAGTFYSAVEANKSYVLSFNLKEKMSASSLQNRRLSLYLNDSVSLYSWTDTDTIGKQRITITPTASGYLNFWAGADVFSANTEIIDDIYLTDITTTATIQLGQTVYGAEINWDTGVMTVKTTKETFDGSSSAGWSYVSDYGSVSRFDCTNVLGKAGGNVISNYLKGGNDTSIIPNKEHVYLHGSYGYLIICVETSRLATKDVTGLMSYLASNPLQVEYELATPTTIQLTPEQLEMLKGYNRVTISDGYGTIELKALTGANWS